MDSQKKMDSRDIFQAAYGMVTEISQDKKYNKTEIYKNHAHYGSNPVFRRLMENCMPLYKGILLQSVQPNNFHILCQMLIENDNAESTLKESTNVISNMLAHEHGVDWSKLNDKKKKE